MRHLISINDLSKDELDHILCKSQEYIARAKKKDIKPNPGKKAIFAFFEASTRTRGSYVEAARLLGWEKDMVVGAEATSLMKKESLANTARMFALQGADVLVMRTKVEGAQRFAAEILEQEGYEISVQNAGDGTNQHPTQTILDLLTIKEKLRRLDGFKIGFFGDLKYGRTVHSLLCALSLREDISVVFVSDPETKLQSQYRDLFNSPKEGEFLELLSDCDIIYGARLQEERFTGDQMALQRARGRYKISAATLGAFRKNVIIMHPMPYVEEFDPNIRRDPRLILDQQAWYGIPVRMFLLDEGYQQKNALGAGQPKADCELSVVLEMKLEEYLEKRAAKKATENYFMPIRSGTVIDHIPYGWGLKIRSMLAAYGFFRKGVKHTIEDVPSKKFGQKDVLVLENIFLPPEFMGAISVFTPTATFNLVAENFQKVRVKAPPYIKNIGACPNKDCITNHDPEAQARFWHSRKRLKCAFCEKFFTNEEVV